MKNKITLLITLGLTFLALPIHAQDDYPTNRTQVLELIQSLKYQQGEVDIEGGLAKLNVPKEFHFLGKEDAEKVLVKLWRNPPSSEVLGLLMPSDRTPLDEDCWVVSISYDEDGYVKDDEASKIDYGDLLKDMKKGTKAASKERTKQGYPSVELIGWAAPPHYDMQTHKLYWAKELQFGNDEERTLNYNIRILGRRGVLVLNAIASMSQLSKIEQKTPDILTMVNFNEGHRYSDFDPKIDKVATYGIAALVAGGIATKLGFFKLIWVFLLAAKKFVIIALVAIAAGLKKLFRRNNSTSA